jgi:hypothetical protein
MSRAIKNQNLWQPYTFHNSADNAKEDKNAIVELKL